MLCLPHLMFFYLVDIHLALAFGVSIEHKYVLQGVGLMYRSSGGDMDGLPCR